MVTLLTGAGSGLGRRVAASLHDDSIVEIEPSETGAAPAGRLVHLAAGDHDGLASRRMNAVDITQRVLDTATNAGVDHVVLLSSAMVYGAWPNNPVPLTEDAPLRPDPGFAFVEQVAQVEQMADAWRTSAPGRRVAVLRPALALAADGTSSVVRALAAGLGTRIDEDDPPAQFLHLDDLASAVVLAHEQRLDGVFNVAADGGSRGKLSAPSPADHRACDCRLGWRSRLPTSAGVSSGARFRPAFVRTPAIRGSLPVTAFAPRMGADDDERAGVRRRHGGEVVDHAHAQAGSRSCRWPLCRSCR